MGRYSVGIFGLFKRLFYIELLVLLEELEEYFEEYEPIDHA